VIVSRKKRFLFFHIPKTGGHTITHRLAKFLEVRSNKIEDIVRILHYHKGGNLHSKVSSQDNWLFMEKHRDFFSFAYVRNPWDRIFSYYLSGRRNGKTVDLISIEDFSKFFDEVKDGTHRYSGRIKQSQVDQLISPIGEIGVKYVARFEDFENEFDSIIEKLNIDKSDINYDVIDNKSNHKGLKYQDLYIQKNIDWIAKVHREDIDFFGYTY